MSQTVIRRKATAAQRRLFSNPYFWGAVFGVVAITALRPLLRRVPEPPAVVRQLPSFLLLNDRGERFGSKELQGKTYIASFFFTRCTTVCPHLAQLFRRLQGRLDAMKLDIKLVSFSVDAENDRPADLRQYAKTYGVDSHRWHLLTAPRDDMRAVVRLAREGFSAAAETAPNATGGSSQHGATTHRVVDDGGIEIVHARRVAIVDRDGRLRGMYPADQKHSLAELLHRAVAVQLEP